jgi:hypothetical protein
MENIMQECPPFELTIVSEPELWAVQEQIVKDAFKFWEDFLQLRQGVNNDKKLDDVATSRFICIIRAVSWVESKHGTVGVNQAQKDPIQVGNPGDSAWKQFSGQVVNKDRFVGGPGAANYYANELPSAVENLVGFPLNGKLTSLVSKNDGHKDSNFNSTMSYYWGIAFLIHKINTKVVDGRTYKCGDCSVERMKNGAVAYNGRGDSTYKVKLEDALALIKCMK